MFYQPRRGGSRLFSTVVCHNFHSESMKDIVIVAGKRTAMGEYGGALRDFSVIELGAIAAKAAVAQSGFDAADFGHVIFGNAMQTSSDAVYGARHVALRAGLPIGVPALTVNRLCGSGIQ